MLRTLKGAAMEHFIHRQNLKLLKKQLEAPTDEAKRRMVLSLLAEEEAKAPTLEAKSGGRD